MLDEMLKLEKRPERERLMGKVSVAFMLRVMGELLCLFKIRFVFLDIHSGGSVGDELGKEEMEATSPWRKRQRTKRAMECQSWWRTFPQKRPLASVLHPLQVCQRAAHLHFHGL